MPSCQLAIGLGSCAMDLAPGSVEMARGLALPHIRDGISVLTPALTTGRRGGVAPQHRQGRGLTERMPRGAGDEVARAVAHVVSGLALGDAGTHAAPVARPHRAPVAEL